MAHNISLQRTAILRLAAAELKSLGAIALGCIAFLTWPAIASGCSCIWTGPPGTQILSSGLPAPSQDDLRDQQFLFSGTVMKTDPIPTGDALADQYFSGGSKTVFSVDDSWRGARGYDTITVTSGNPSGGCGYTFEIGVCYLVFGYVDPDGTLQTSTCTHTLPYQNAGDLIGIINILLGPPWNVVAGLNDGE